MIDDGGEIPEWEREEFARIANQLETGERSGRARTIARWVLVVTAAGCATAVAATPTARGVAVIVGVGVLDAVIVVLLAVFLVVVGALTRDVARDLAPWRHQADQDLNAPGQ